jgi:ABC-type transport system involved in multi-copper enzyme maturation permease subunit
MSLEMVRVELLKLRKRRGLFWWSLFLTVGTMVLFFGITEALHLTSPAKYEVVGGMHGLMNTLSALSTFGVCAAILIGATAGSQDLSSGVFRDLASTGRSRWALFLARIPGVLSLLLPMVAAAFAIGAVFIVGFHGGRPAIGAVVLVRSFGWVLLATGIPALVALGAASIADNRGIVIGVLIAWFLVAEQLLSQATALGAARIGILSVALTRLVPIPGQMIAGVHVAVATAFAVLAAWAGVALFAGGLRTATRDA